MLNFDRDKSQTLRKINRKKVSFFQMMHFSLYTCTKKLTLSACAYREKGICTYFLNKKEENLGIINALWVILQHKQKEKKTGNISTGHEAFRLYNVHLHARNHQQLYTTFFFIQRGGVELYAFDLKKFIFVIG